MITFIINLMHSSLELPDNLDLCIERAHRSLTVKPKESAPPRSIIVRFSNYRVKETILQQGWIQRGGTYQGQKVFFDQDYTSDVKQKCKRVREVIKQLKEKTVKAQSSFPAQLKIYLEFGVKTFTSLAEVAPPPSGVGYSYRGGRTGDSSERPVTQCLGLGIEIKQRPIYHDQCRLADFCSR